MKNPNAKKSRLFILPDGRNVAFTFTLVSSLFLLWGFCNGMIDVMDKHFQEELHLTLSQSAWVQFAHYLGYFLMSIPAGWLAGKLGYKGGIIAGLLMVALGGFWFIPATHIAAFWAFLLGVCIIASGLTFLETVANPYTTVLGDSRFAATRINLAQTANSIGWLLGPFAGARYFYSKDANGVSTGSQTLWIPYAGVAVVVLVLAVVFYFVRMPDVRAEDDYHVDNGSSRDVDKKADRQVNRPLVHLLLWLNVGVLLSVFGMIFWLIFSAFDVRPWLVSVATHVPHPASLKITADNSLEVTMCAGVVLLMAIAGLALVPVARKISHHSIWSHPHFSAATMAQFLYVAAQAGIFSFAINYMTSEVPAIRPCWLTRMLTSCFEMKDGALHFSNAGAAYLVPIGFFCFGVGRFSGAAILKKFSAHKTLGLCGVLNVVACLLVFLKLGWLSVACVFLTYLFMSIMFPTIFALGIFGLGTRAKRASSYIVMAIMGGAVLPKLMGHVADRYDMSRAFIVPLVCFAAIALYGFCWPKLSQADDLAQAR